MERVTKNMPMDGTPSGVQTRTCPTPNDTLLPSLTPGDREGEDSFS